MSDTTPSWEQAEIKRGKRCCLLTLGAQPKSLVCNELICWEAVVQLHHVDITGPQTCSFEALCGRQPSHVVSHLDRWHETCVQALWFGGTPRHFHQSERTHHLHAAVLFKGGGGVGCHLLSNNLHGLALQMMFPDKGLAGQNRSSGAIWCRTDEREPTSRQRDGSFSGVEGDGCSRLSPTLQQSEVLKHLPGVNHLLQTVLILELGISAQAPAQSQISQTHWKQIPGLLEGIFSYGLLVECLWFFQAILAKCSGLVPERDPNTNTVKCTHEKKTFLPFDTRVVFTIFLHMFSAGVAEHLGSSRSSSHPIAVDHHLHVLVHWIGPVHKLG